jgi:HD superfamily phosphohydrolase
VVTLCRFEHALGVAHLAEKMVKSLVSHQANLKEVITKEDILCVKVTGLPIQDRALVEVLS